MMYEETGFENFYSLLIPYTILVVKHCTNQPLDTQLTFL